MDAPLERALALMVALTLVRALLRAVARPVAWGIVLGGLLVLVGVLSPSAAMAVLATGVRWLVQLCAVVLRMAATTG